MKGSKITVHAENGRHNGVCTPIKQPQGFGTGDSIPEMRAMADTLKASGHHAAAENLYTLITLRHTQQNTQSARPTQTRNLPINNF